ncbi:PE domain-containing protein [Mycobacterium ahvazicum]|nr:PE domain-containing protein [Mycobacterium ahvazicum]
MTRPLLVDTHGLANAGSTLGDLAFPAPPQTLGPAGGTDLVSVAVTETVSALEAPVVDGLPAAQVALNRTAANLTAAAGRYARTDHLMGQRIRALQLALAKATSTGTCEHATQIF